MHQHLLNPLNQILMCNSKKLYESMLSAKLSGKKAARIIDNYLYINKNNENEVTDI